MTLDESQGDEEAIYINGLAVIIEDAAAPHIQGLLVTYENDRLNIYDKRMNNIKEGDGK